jgi:DNA-binding transcriptional LysR family regulator
VLDVRRLQALRELDRHGTIAAAADALNLTASAVSQQLAALERDVGRRLLEPHGRGVRLTPAAGILLEHADVLFAQLERLDADLEADAAAGGHVRVAAFPTAVAGLVAPAARELRHAGIELAVTESEAPDSFRRLAAREADVVVSMEHAGAPQADDPRTYRRDLVADVMDAALPADHPLAARTGLSLRSLRAEPWVLPPVGWTCDEVVTAACQASGFTPRAAHRAGDWVATLALVSAGLGISVLPRLARVQAPPNVVIRPLRGEPPRRQLFAACHRGAEARPAIAATLDALADAAERSRRSAHELAA